MKRLLAALLASSALACASPAAAAIAIIASSHVAANNSTSASTITATSTVDVPIGSLSIIMCGIRGGDDVNAPADTAGNAYTATSAEFQNNGAQNFRVFYSVTTVDKPIGDVTTCNYSAVDTSHKYMHIGSFSGMASSSTFDAQPTGASGTTGNPSAVTGTLNYSGKAQILIIASLTVNSTPTATPNGTWVDLGFGGASMDFEYNIVNQGTTTNTFNPTTSPNNIGWDVLLPDFRGSAAGTTPKGLPGSLMMLGVEQ